MTLPLLDDETFGLVRPSIDAHTLGMSYVAKLLRDAGYRVVLADRAVTEAVNAVQGHDESALLRNWIKAERITRLGLSYRLDPDQAADLFSRLHWQLRDAALLGDGAGKIRGVYFAGLPAACDRIRRDFAGAIPVFCGDETPVETLARFGVPESRIPASLSRQSAYDDTRMAFGRALVERGEYRSVAREDRSGYPEFGTRADHVFKRVDHARRLGQSPLMRVHVGPYHPNRREAISQFIDWLMKLGRSGLLDIVSIGTSQLTQERFGEDWADRPNGGGVPVNSEEEYHRIWQAARPMLVRTYAGTKRIPQLAQMHERTINIAWHALSFWWFSRIDGRGPHTVLENLREHMATLDFIAESGKPFEPNIPHHFAFRGGDDVTYVVAAVLAARTAKRRGVRQFILQNMLNTPKYTAGVQDLAKARAMLKLVRELEDGDFRVLLQPRAGLDYFSPDLEKAKAQLAAVSAMMDDIEPGERGSPDIIHVVSYSEASHLADPAVIDESIQITRHAIDTYRIARVKGRVPDMTLDAEVQRRTAHLVEEARELLAGIEQVVPNLYSAEGLYEAFRAGFLAAPYLWEEREEFANAISWRTELVDGGIAIVDPKGRLVSARDRVELCRAMRETERIGAIAEG
jgi:hypothetical protein